MSTAQIREKLHQLINNADERFIKMVYALAKEYQKDDFELSSEHQKILDERLASYKNDPDSGSDWDQVKRRIETQL
ncbi:MAG: addiction module protein [Flavobacteriales bacterium]|nr:addiction module protein [Flavobacteriales bacterium]